MKRGTRSAATLLPMLLMIAVEAQMVGTGCEPPTIRVLSIPFDHPFVLPPGTVLPDTFDLRPWCPPAGDQRKQNSCTAWALGYGLATIKVNISNDRRTPDPFGKPDPEVVLSPAYLFNIVKQELDPTGCDRGTAMDKPISVLTEVGCCSWATFPYDTSITGCEAPVPYSVMRRGVGQFGWRPVRIITDDTEQWKYQLSRSQPIAVHLFVDSAFVADGFATQGERIFTWEPDGSRTMGHAVVCVGYDDRDSTFLIMNSWGQGWGHAGFARIPYAVLRDFNYNMEAYVFEEGIPAAQEVMFGRRSAMVHAPDPVLRVKAGIGEELIWNGMRVMISGRSPDGQRIGLVFQDTRSGSTMNRVTYALGQPRTFVHDGHAITVTYTSFSGATGNPTAELTLARNDPEQWAHIRVLLGRWGLSLP